jgi:alpha-mannosidase
MLKLAFHVNIDGDITAAYDIPFGAIERPVNGTEESGQMWFAASDGRRGLAVLNNGKYSFDVLGNEMRVTVANGSMYADHYTGQNNRDGLCEYLDQGIQRFKYAMYPFSAPRRAEINKAAYELNTEETHINETYHTGNLPRVYEGISISAGNVIATALKPAYDGGGYALRLCEYEGKATVCEVKLPPLNRAFIAELTANAVATYYIPKDPNNEIKLCDFRELLS